MTVGLLAAAVLAVYVGVLLWRGQWSERAALLAGIGLGVLVGLLLIPQVLAFGADAAGKAAALFSTARSGLP